MSEKREVATLLFILCCCALTLSMAFVVQITRRIAGTNMKNGMICSHALFSSLDDHQILRAPLASGESI